MEVKSFGQTVRNRREEEGWSQEELARKAGISRNYLSQIERGVATNLSWHILQSLAIVLGLKLPEALKEQQRGANLPPGLSEFARRANLPDGDIEMLSQIRYRGRQPNTSKEWEILYKAIKIAMEEA